MRVSNGIREIDGSGARLDDGSNDLAQELGVRACGVLGAEFDIVEVTARALDGAYRAVEALRARAPQLAAQMNLRCGDEDVQPCGVRMLERRGGFIDVALPGARECRHRAAAHVASDFAYAGSVCRRAGREARLDHVDTELLELHSKA